MDSHTSDSWVMTELASEVLDGYVECAIWTEADTGEGSPGGAETIGDIAPESLAEVKAEVIGFLEANAADLEASGQSGGQIGHDLWLTRNGHGAGFWDRGLGEVGDRLTEACRPMGESNLMYGDDGRLYFD